jgi:hypothetical protein
MQEYQPLVDPPEDWLSGKKSKIPLNKRVRERVFQTAVETSPTSFCPDSVKARSANAVNVVLHLALQRHWVAR